GSTYVKLRVSDGKEDGTIEQLFYIQVTEPVNNAPVASDIPTQEMNIDDEPLELFVSDYFVDEDGDELTAAVKSVSSSNVSAVSDGKKVTLSPSKVGEAIVTLVVTDPKGLSVQKTFKVVVNEVLPLEVTEL